MAWYRSQNILWFKQAIQEHEPIFIIASHPSLRKALHPDPAVQQQKSVYPLLLEEDGQFLRDHYIHHWANIHVAGKKFRDLPAGETYFDIVISGPYTITSTSPVMLDGSKPVWKKVVHLEKGRHSLVLAEPSRKLVIKWGDDLHKPETQITSGMFVYF
jgi:hypothetical protein